MSAEAEPTSQTQVSEGKKDSMSKGIQPKPEVQVTEEREDSTPTKPGLDIAFLMTAHWMAYLTAITTDTLIAVRHQMFSGRLWAESPIVRYIYREHIDKWPMSGFYIVSPPTPHSSQEL